MERFITRLAAILLAGAFVCSLAACTGGEKESAPSETETEQETEKAAE